MRTLEEVTHGVQIKVLFFVFAFFSHIDCWTWKLGFEILHLNLLVELFILPNAFNIVPVVLLIMIFPLVGLCFDLNKPFVKIFSLHKVVDFILSKVVLKKFVVNGCAHQNNSDLRVSSEHSFY